MFSELRSAFERSKATFLQDLVGASSIVILLVASLYLPSFF